MSTAPPARRGSGVRRADTPENAVQNLIGCVEVVQTEAVELAQCAGRVLAADLVTDRPSPAADVSAMDGYAVRLSDLSAGELRVRDEIRIGQCPPKMPEGAVLRIVTGAPVPEGADAVVKREDVREGKGRINIDRGVAANIRPGENIRRRGENLGAGELVVRAGALITPAVAGALSAFGVTRVTVRRRVRVGVIVTGDELVETAGTPSAWQVRDSNGAALGALLGTRPWLEVGPVRRAADDPKRLESVLAEVLESCDAVLLTGGVSMGTRDYVPGVITDTGARVVFHKLPQKPGKPVLGAVWKDRTPILALPGNPVSVLVTARRMAVPVLAARAGMEQARPVGATVEDADNKAIELWWYRLVCGSGAGVVKLADNRGSGDVVAAARSDGFVEVPPGKSGAGPWPFYRWDS